MGEGRVGGRPIWRRLEGSGQGPPGAVSASRSRARPSVAAPFPGENRRCARAAPAGCRPGRSSVKPGRRRPRPRGRPANQACARYRPLPLPRSLTLSVRTELAYVQQPLAIEARTEGRPIWTVLRLDTGHSAAERWEQLPRRNDDGLADSKLVVGDGSSEHDREGDDHALARGGAGGCKPPLPAPGSPGVAGEPEPANGGT